MPSYDFVANIGRQPQRPTAEACLASAFTNIYQTSHSTSIQLAQTIAANLRAMHRLIAELFELLLSLLGDQTALGATELSHC